MAVSFRSKAAIAVLAGLRDEGVANAVATIACLATATPVQAYPRGGAEYGPNAGNGQRRSATN